MSLNIELTDSIGVSGTLPEFVLPAGVWEIEFYGLFEGVGAHDLRLWDITNNARVTTFAGTGGRAVTANQTQVAAGRGRVSPSTATTYKFVTRVQTTNSGDGQGGIADVGGYFASADCDHAVAVITEARSMITGPAGTVAIGTVDTVGPDDPATVTNVGTPSAALLNIEIPRGADPEITVDGVDTLDPDEPATVTNEGTAGAPSFRFGIPAGVSAFVYVAYASADDGSDFALAPGPGLSYVAILATDTEIAEPAAGDFAGLWYQYAPPTPVVVLSSAAYAALDPPTSGALYAMTG
jgi:hypothetical protein